MKKALRRSNSIAMAKRRIALLILVVILGGAACGSDRVDLTEPQKIEIENQVMASFDGLVKAAKTLRPEPYFEYIDKEKLTTLNQDGTVTLNFKDFAESYRKSVETFSSYEELTFKNVKVTVIDANTAVLVNEFAVKVALKSGSTISAGGAGTQVWNKQNQVWKIVHISDSSKQMLP